MILAKNNIQSGILISTLHLNSSYKKFYIINLLFYFYIIYMLKIIISSCLYKYPLELSYSF